MGAVGVAILAYWLQGESFDAPKLACISMILLGVVGLKAFALA